MSLAKIRIVLVNTSHPGNIGSVARAMKTMGLSRLYLVAPKAFPHPKALELASNADDILEQAIVVPDLNQALQGCGVVLGTSARDRSIPLPCYTPHECAAVAISHTPNHDVAIVFGREHAGLTNEEILRCNYQVVIPANPDYSSLNIAAAVQVICYELRLAVDTAIKTSLPSRDRIATADEVENFYQHLQTVLQQVDFLKEATPRRLMPRLRRLFNRVKLEHLEINILRGILTAVQRQLKLK